MIDTPHRRIPWLAVLAPGLLAVLCFWSTLSGGFLSDDFTLSKLFDARATGVDWGEVFADFGRPFFGLEAAMYRPVLTLSFGIDAALWGADPYGFHLTNLLLHVLGTCATAVAAACVAAPGRYAALAAITCGSLAAIHPVAVESVAWIAARNSGIEVAFRALALALFALHMRTPSRSLFVGSIAFAAVALGCKESAVVVLPSAIALDLLCRPDRPLAERVRLHVPMAVLLFAYFVWRTLLFGTPIGSAGTNESGGNLLSIAGYKLGQTLLPASGEVRLPIWGFAAFGAAYGLAVRSTFHHPRLLTMTALLWLPVTVGPTFALALGDELTGSRMLLGSTQVLAITLAALLFGRPSRIFWVIVLVMTAAVSACITPTNTRIARYESAWVAVGTATARVGEVCAESVDEKRPLALVYMPQITGVPPLNPNAWFPLAERPVQAEDHPMVSLAYAVWGVPVPGSEELLGDVSAARPLWHAGAPIVGWDARLGDLARVAPKGASPLLDLTQGDPGRFAFTTPVHPFACERLTLHAARGVTGGRVRILDAPGGLGSWTLGTPSDVDDDTVAFDVDLTHSTGPFALAMVGLPLGGFEVELEGGDARALVAHARVPELALPDPLDGSNVRAEELASRLTAPDSERPLRLILIGPQGAIRFAVDASGAVKIPDDDVTLLRVIAEFSRGGRFYYFWEVDPTAGGAGVGGRSGLDRVVLRKG